MFASRPRRFGTFDCGGREVVPVQTVTVTRDLDADPDCVRAAILDVGEFMRAGGFDDVSVEGDVVTITNSVGLVTIELVLEVVDDPNSVLTYEQRDGIFEEMVTRYDISETNDGVAVSATTDFALQARLVGPLLDATVIDRQRRVELNAQFDYLAKRCE
ncbi:SRPBCC family protein [Haloarcula amylovorans]|uniref:SRPBCC family protein n=1 Tax=Haloarcula amylovorans TaxID=2562280 RepID=UPI001FD83B50|nr:SRPBCC family protein [Halomicroarcula amylolytica]